MYIRTIFEAFAVVLLIAGFFAEDKLIAFEQRIVSFAIECRKRLRRYLISVRKDASAIYRACKRQGITFFRFVAILCKFSSATDVMRQILIVSGRSKAMDHNKEKVHLEPCPYCGGSAYIDGFSIEIPHIRAHHTRQCRMKPDTWLLSSEPLRKQIKAWNLRPKEE